MYNQANMMSSSMGNQITNNAFGADDAKELIERALTEVRAKTGWYLRDEKVLFSGHYYDRKKIGSFIARITNDRQESAVLKLQLRPLDYDEGMIIRHIQAQIKTDRVRLPVVHLDEPWEESRGYGYLIMEDASEMKRLWAEHCPTDAELKEHAEFLDIFMHQVLPIDAFLPAPKATIREKYQEGLQHFSKIAKVSNHHHVSDEEVEQMKEVYAGILKNITFNDFHFTHGHLSGMDIFLDSSNQSYILFSNLMWSFRSMYYEVIFPLWVDMMGIRNTSVMVKDLLVRVDRWAEIWEKVMGEDPRTSHFFWFLILERSMMTVMLDLGASEWLEGEIEEKRALLNAWKELFWFVVKNKLNER